MNTNDSLLQKRRFNNSKDINDEPLLKKPKISNNLIVPHRFSSLCCSYGYESAVTISLSVNKTIYAFGYNQYCSHGDTSYAIDYPKQINSLSNIKIVSCGFYHTICIDYSEIVYSFGDNSYGQLGIGKTRQELEKTHIPQKINVPPCKEVSSGNSFSMCLSEDGILYSFGDNEYGQLGLGHNNQINSPVQISTLHNIEFIECGAFHSICKLYNNSFYSWGNNAFGELGHGNSDNISNKPIQCNNWPDNIVDVKCGSRHSLLLTLDGKIYSFGRNNGGQLGLNDKDIELIEIPTLITDIPNIKRIECANFNCLCIDINNNLWLFGNNFSGQLGLGDTENRYKPTIHSKLTYIVDISSGGNCTFIKTSNNKIYAFGNNKYKQLGITTPNNKQVTPIQVFIDNEDIWCSTVGKSKQKSARK